jgi:hypothetical protein
MRKGELSKRNHLIKGTPVSKKPKPKDSGRRGTHVVFEEKEEYDVAYNDFFEFQKDLDELEASNEMTRRAAIYGGTDDKEEKIEKEVSSIVMEEETEEDRPVFSPIIMEDYEEVEAPPSFKRCLYIKANGERCKRQAPKKGTLCAAHRKK